MDIRFEKIIPTEEQIDELYLFIKNRKHSVSHKITPLFSEHSDFVKNHPYISWYIVYKGAKPICSCYVQNDNSIGINFTEGYEEFFIQIIDFIKKTHKPQLPIKSIRREGFFVNVASKNTKLIQFLNSTNFQEIQRSFEV